MKTAAVASLLLIGFLTGCAAGPERTETALEAKQGYDPGGYRFVSFNGIATEAGYWRQDLGRAGLAGPIGDLKECLVQEVVKGSSPALHNAVRRFLADKTEANYRDFPPKAEWFIGSGKISFDHFGYFAYARCAHQYPPEEQQAGS